MEDKMLVPYEQNGGLPAIDNGYDPMAGETGTGGAGILAALLRRWYVAVAAAAVVIGIGLPVIWLTIKPLYTATSAIQISPVIPRLVFQDESGTMPFYSNYVNTQAALIKSNRILYPLIEDPLVRTLPYMKSVSDPLADLQANLDASVDRKSQLLLVTMTGEDPKAVTEIANAAVRAYMRIEGGSEATSEDETLRTLERERDAASEQLRGLYEQQHQLGEEYGTTDLAAREEIMLTRIQSLQEDMTRTELQKLALQSQAKEIESKQAAPPSPSELVKLKSDTVSADPNVTLLSNTVSALERDQVIEKLKRKDDAPDLKFVERQIAALKAKLADARKEAEARFDEMMAKEMAVQLKTSAQEVTTRLGQLDQHITQVKADIEKENADLIGLGRKDLAIKKISDEIKLKNDLYERLVQRIQVLQVERQRPARISVAYNAEPPRGPSKDKRGKYSVALIMGALLFGCALTIFIHELDMRVESPADLAAKCKVRILGTTPRFKDLDKARVQARHFVDDCRTIRVNLMLADSMEHGHAIVMASPQGRDGKTTVAINLATSIALTGKRVLLIDGDFRKPEVARYLRLDNKKGLTNVLAGECTLDEAIQETPVHTLNILPANRSGQRQSELLVSRRLSAILAELRLRYDEIVVDTPAILAMPDAKLWACLADGVVLVARSGKTGIKELIEAKVRLQQAGARILGAVVTGVRISDSYEKYSHRYGEGYVEEPVSQEDWDAAKVFLLSRTYDPKLGSLPAKKS